MAPVETGGQQSMSLGQTSALTVQVQDLDAHLPGETQHSFTCWSLGVL